MTLEPEDKETEAVILSANFEYLSATFLDRMDQMLDKIKSKKHIFVHKVKQSTIPKTKRSSYPRRYN